MADVNIVCTNTGQKLASLPVAIQRGYALIRDITASQGKLSIEENHPKVIGKNFAPGNILYVYSDQAGVPEWAAVMWGPEPTGYVVNDGVLTVPLRSCEWLLSKRVTAPQETFSGTPGEIFVQLLKSARRKGYLPIDTDTSGIDLRGKVSSPQYRCANIYEAASKLANDNGMYWWFQPYTDPLTNVVALKPYFRQRRSSVFSTTLRTGGQNPNFMAMEYNETGEIVNHVIAYARTKEGQPLIFYEEEDAASIGRYKQVYSKSLPNLEETTAAGLVPAVQAELDKNAFMKLRISGAVTSPPYPREGHVVVVSIAANSSYLTSRRGSLVTMEVKKATYSPTENTMAVALEEILS